jgi:hypothetical protein
MHSAAGEFCQKMAGLRRRNSTRLNWLAEVLQKHRNTLANWEQCLSLPDSEADVKELAAALTDSAAERGELLEAYRADVRAKERRPRNGVATSAPRVAPPAIAQPHTPVLELLLRQAGDCCSICQRPSTIAAYPISGDPRPRPDMVGDWIVLCTYCHRQCVEQGVPSAQLCSIKQSWTSLPASEKSPRHRMILAESLYTRARGMSLQRDAMEIKRARVLCQQVLNMIDPFHVNARLLLEELQVLERRLDQGEQEGERSLSAYSPPFIWCIIAGTNVVITSITSDILGLAVGIIVLIILTILSVSRHQAVIYLSIVTIYWAMLLHQFVRAFAIYLRGTITDSYGRSVPLRKCVRGIEINELPWRSGVVEAIHQANHSGRFPRLSLNVNRIEREWYDHAR